MGLDRAGARARPASPPAANLWANGKWKARIPVGDIGQDLSPYPFILMLGQDDNERIMGAKLGELGVPIRWNTELIAFEQKPDYVEATLRAARRHRPRHHRRLGRGLRRFAQRGARAERHLVSGRAIRADLLRRRYGSDRFDEAERAERLSVARRLPPVLSDARQGSMAGDRHPARSTCATRDDVTFDEVVPSIRGEAGADLAFKQCSWFSTYRIHHRAAERFRDRRCFLLGDAAHIHSPAGAQGMNTGLQDAYNLGMEARAGRAGPCGCGPARYLRTGAHSGRAAPARDHRPRVPGWSSRTAGCAGLLRTTVIARVAATAMKFAPVRRFAFRTISQIGISYPQSPLSQALAGLPKDAPAAGERFPWMRIRLQAGWSGRGSLRRARGYALQSPDLRRHASATGRRTRRHDADSSHSAHCGE